MSLRTTSTQLLTQLPEKPFPGQPIPILDNRFHEEIFPNIQNKPSVAQLETVSFYSLKQNKTKHLTQEKFNFISVLKGLLGEALTGSAKALRIRNNRKLLAKPVKLQILNT